jgi:lipoprotein NlpD
MRDRLPLLSLVLVLLMAGCASSRHKAPVEDRSAAPRQVGAAVAAPAAASAASAPDGKPLPGAENAGKPGYYTVKPGDTLIRIGLENGQNWRDVVRWNNIENPNLIEVGQVLRVVPPDRKSVV